ncbi:MAG: hypothetical protein ACOVSW_05480 [Candidatus Kapaibacteriota bacterium]|jgi:hypothetical protein
MQYSFSTQVVERSVGIQSFDAPPNSAELRPLTAVELRKLPKNERSARLRGMFLQAAQHLASEEILHDTIDIIEP